MKSILTITLTVFIFIITACNRDITGEDVSNDITGTWELRATSGGMMPGVKSHPAGNGTSLIFTKDTYQMYDKNVLSKSGNYTIVKDSTFEESVCLEKPKGQFEERIIYDGDTTDAKQFFQIVKNKLIVKSGCYALDGGSTQEYEKINSKAD